MSALPVPAQHPDSADQACANGWIARHYDELSIRASACFAWLPVRSREEAVAEVLALVTHAVHSAARRGVLKNLTPSTCVGYAARQVRCGRRSTGSGGNDVLAERTRWHRDIRVVSFDEIRPAGHDRACSLRETLADRDAEDPAEVARRNHDYARMLQDGSVSEKARAVFEFLGESHGSGKQKELAVKLRITPARITQLKRELATAFGRFGYAGPLQARVPAM